MNDEKHHEVLKNYTHEHLRNFVINLAKLHYGNDVEIKKDGGCCPPGVCGVCVGGACIGC